MSWHYSQALVVEYLAALSLDGALSVLLSETNMPQAYLSKDRMKDFSRLSRFGMTFEPLTDDVGEDVLTWCLEDSRARTSARPVVEPASPANDPAYGLSSLASLAKYDHGSRLWRIPQFSLLGDSESYSETWPRSGLMRDGECYQLPPLALRTAANESGLWQTPVADDACNREEGKWNSRGEPKLSAQVKLWPTPTVHGNHNRKGASKNSGDGLSTAVKQWPTPTSSLGTKGGRVTPRKSRHGGTLIEAVSAETFATPTAMDWRSGKASQATMERNSRPLSEQIGGQLNPTWVEWLMGWPLGWTDLDASATDKYPNAPLKRGAC